MKIPAASLLFLFLAEALTTTVSAAASCPSTSTTVNMGGSKDLQPLATAWINAYKEKCTDSNIALEPATHSTVGARRVCNQGNTANETALHVGTLSREWKDEEATSDNGFHWKCSGSDREIIQVDVATYGLSIVVATGGVAHDCVSILGGLTMDQLRWIYSDFTREQLIATGWDPSSLENDDKDDSTHLWSELDARCAKEEILISGKPRDTPDYEFFYDETFKSKDEDIPIDTPRKTGPATYVQYTGSDNDLELVQFIAGSTTAISFFAYNTAKDYDQLTSVPIQNKYGLMVQPDTSNIAGLDYTPFSRKMHMEVWNDGDVLDAMKGFFEFAFSKKGDELVESVGYFPTRKWEKVVMLTLLDAEGGVNLEDFDCGSDSGDFEIAGSLTAHPVAQVWSEMYTAKCSHVGIKYRGGGSSKGAGRVCGVSKSSSVEIGTMSRDWRDSEAVTRNGYYYDCVGSDRYVVQVDVAIEALVVTYKRDSVAEDCIDRLGGLTIDQLRWMYSSFDETQLRQHGWDSRAVMNSDGDPTTHLWSELMNHPDCPATEIKISGISSESTIYDFFTEFVTPSFKDGEELRTGIVTKDEEEELVQFLVENGDGISFYGYTHYELQEDPVWAAKIRNDRGHFIEPLGVSVEDGTYSPFSRRLTMNVVDNHPSQSLTTPFLEFGLSTLGEELLEYTGNIPIPELERVTMRTRVQTASAMELPQIEECGPEGRELKIAGSTTVYHIVNLWGGMYEIGCDVKVNAEGGGSSGGADRVCGGGDGPVDIGMMSRDWKPNEAKTERSLSFSYQCVDFDTTRSAVQIPVAIDSLAVATSRSGIAQECIEKIGGLSPDQLRWIFSNYSTKKLEESGWDSSSVPNSDGDDSTHLWSELSSDCASTEILIGGPDDMRESFYYMQETVLLDHSNGENFDTNRLDSYYGSARDDEIVSFLKENSAGIAFFEYSFFAANRSPMSAVPVKNKSGKFVSPSIDTITDGSYEPLSRLIFANLYEDKESLAATVPFIKFGLSIKGQQLVELAGYASLSPFERDTVLNTLDAAVNAVMGGSSSQTVTNTQNNDNSDNNAGVNSPSSSESYSEVDEGGSLAGGAVAGIIIVCLLAVGAANVIIFRKYQTSKEADTGDPNNLSPYARSRTNWAHQEPEVVEESVPSTEFRDDPSAPKEFRDNASPSEGSRTNWADQDLEEYPVHENSENRCYV